MIFSECEVHFLLGVGNQVNITSPLFPSYYPDNLDCMWQFSTPDNAGTWNIIFETFLTTDSIYASDYLTIGKGDNVSLENTLVQFHKFVSPGFVVSITSNQIWIHFASSIQHRHTGFSLNISLTENQGKVNRR